VEIIKLPFQRDNILILEISHNRKNKNITLLKMNSDEFKERPLKKFKSQFLGISGGKGKKENFIFQIFSKKADNVKIQRIK